MVVHCCSTNLLLALRVRRCRAAEMPDSMRQQRPLITAHSQPVATNFEWQVRHHAMSATMTCYLKAAVAGFQDKLLQDLRTAELFSATVLLSPLHTLSPLPPTCGKCSLAPRTSAPHAVLDSKCCWFSGRDAAGLQSCRALLSNNIAIKIAHSPCFANDGSMQWCILLVQTC